MKQGQPSTRSLPREKFLILKVGQGRAWGLCREPTTFLHRPKKTLQINQNVGPPLTSKRRRHHPKGGSLLGGITGESDLILLDFKVA